MTDGRNAVVAILGDDRIRDSLVRAVAGLGYRVEEASSGERVLQLASEGAGLIILGGRMPDLEATSILRRMREGGASEDPIRPGDPSEGESSAAGVGPGSQGVQGSPTAEVDSDGPAGRDGDREDPWQSALDRLGDGIGVLDREGRVVRCNRTLPTLLGRPDESLIGLDLAALIEEGKGSGGGVALPIRRALTMRRRQSGEWERSGRWFRIAVDPLPESRGSIAVVSDVSESRKLRRRIAEAEAQRLEGEARIAQLEHEARVLQQFAPAASVVVPEVSLRNSDPDLFCDLIEEYDALISLMLEQRSYRVEHQAEISRRLREAAGRLGGGGAGPRDVIEVHGTALRRRVSGSNSRMAKAVSEEGRLLVLELMGHLASYYRVLASSARRGTSAGEAPAPEDGRKAMG